MLPPPIIIPPPRKPREEEGRKGMTTARPKFRGTQAALRISFAAGEAARRGIDLIWAIDCTGSVSQHLNRMKELAANSSRLLTELLENVQVGLIAYRDGIEGKLRLSEDLDRFLKTLHALQASKGGDITEGVDLALRLALTSKAMGWRQESDVAVVVLGDAGPKERRGEALLRDIGKLRQVVTRVWVHCVKFGNAVWAGGAMMFFNRLAGVGGGIALSGNRIPAVAGVMDPAVPEIDLVEALCYAISSKTCKVEKKILKRVIQLIIRVES